MSLYDEHGDPIEVCDKCDGLIVSDFEHKSVCACPPPEPPKPLDIEIAFKVANGGPEFGKLELYCVDNAYVGGGRRMDSGIFQVEQDDQKYQVTVQMITEARRIYK